MAARKGVIVFDIFVLSFARASTTLGLFGVIFVPNSKLAEFHPSDFKPQSW
jgi:hypothetical protein